MKIVKVLKCSFSEGAEGWEKDKEFNTFGNVLFKECSYFYASSTPETRLWPCYNLPKFLVEGKELHDIVNHELIKDLFWRRPHQTGQTLYKDFYVVEGFSISNASKGLFAIPSGSHLEDSIKNLFPYQREKVTPKSLWRCPSGAMLCVDKKTFIKISEKDIDFFRSQKSPFDYFHWIKLLDRWDGRLRRKVMDVTDAQINSYVDAVIKAKTLYVMGTLLGKLEEGILYSPPKTIAEWRKIYSERISTTYYRYSTDQIDLFNTLFPLGLKEKDSITLDIDAIKKHMVSSQDASSFIERFGRNSDCLYRDFFVKFYANLNVLAI